MTSPIAGQLAVKPLNIQLFGVESDLLREEVARHPGLNLVKEDPDLVVCYGGDGTLLAAELRWPGIPKVPILNSRRGHRCIPHPADQVISTLAKGALVRNTYTKLQCTILREGEAGPPERHVALNEFNVHMGRINSAVRFKLWIDNEPYEQGLEILGDGFILCTPFGSTAYFSQITRGVFSVGIGIAFKFTRHHISHLVVPDSSNVRLLITRGPAVLAFDSSKDYVSLESGDQLLVSKYPKGAVILTCAPVTRLDEPF